MTSHGLPLDRRTLLRLAGASTLGATALVFADPGTPEALAAARRIAPPKEWGFTGWQAGGPPALPKGDITHFVVHYHGAAGANVNGPAVPRKIDADHKSDPGNSGILYSFVITQDGTIYGARAYQWQSGATKGANEFSISVQLHIHGSTKPSSAALGSLEWLYRHSHSALGSDAALRITGHNDHKATSCPGGPLGAWVDGRGQELYREMAEELGHGTTPAYPGAGAFVLGKSHPAVRTLDEALIAQGYDAHHDGDGYQPGTTFTKYTRLNVQDYQEAQGWSGTDADGYPGPQTWARLMA